MKKGTVSHKMQFFAVYKVVTIPRPQAFHLVVDSLGLLLHRSNNRR